MHASASALASSIAWSRPIPGQIGGSETCEFMALADAGESDLVHCTCGFAADAEAAGVGVTI